MGGIISVEHVGIHEHDIGPVVEQHLLHSVDDRQPLLLVDGARLLGPQAVVRVIAVRRVAVATVLVAHHHIENEAGVDRRDPVPYRKIEVEVFVVEDRFVAEMVAVDSTKYKKGETSDLELDILIYITIFS